MSLKRIETLSDNITNLIIYTPSPSLEVFIRARLRDKFKVHKDFIVNVSKAKELRNAKLDSFVAPLFCDKWLIHVDLEDLSKGDVLNNLKLNTPHGITVYWVKDYRTYMWLSEESEVKKQGVHCPVLSLSRLWYKDVMYLHENLVPKDNRLEQSLLSYVANTYNYDVESICELFNALKSGNEFETKRDIIEYIGVGGNSVGSFVIKVLRANYKTDKGRKRVYTGILKLLDDLSVSYKHATIRRFMLNNINGFIEMKQLQIMGVYGKRTKTIPTSFNIDRLDKLKRYERFILRDISLPTLLNLKLCLEKYNSRNAELDLLQAISEFVGRQRVT